MSRTFRRSNALWMDYYRRCPDEDLEGRWFRKRYGTLTPDEIRKRLQNEFLSDKASRGRYNAPHRYRRYLDKSAKMKNRMALYRTIMTDEEFTEIPVKRNANWYYF